MTAKESSEILLVTMVILGCVRTKHGVELILPKDWESLEIIDKLSFVPLNRETLEAFDQFDMCFEGEYHFYFLRVADLVFTRMTMTCV